MTSIEVLSVVKLNEILWKKGFWMVIWMFLKQLSFKQEKCTSTSQINFFAHCGLVRKGGG